MSEQIDRLVRLPEVRNITGMSTTTIYRWMKKDQFPRSIPITTGTVVWREQDIKAWQRARFSAAGIE